MQSTLTEKVLQAFRQRHLDGNVPALLAQLRELQGGGGGDDTVAVLLAHHEPKDLQQLLCRDLVALLLTQVVRWLGGAVHGDFVRALFSGKTWRALRVHFDACAQLETFQTVGPVILRQLLGATADTLLLSVPLSLERGRLTWDDVAIDLSLGHGQVDDSAATWGLRLRLNLQGVHFSPRWIPENTWPLGDVLHALRCGRDVPVAPHWHFAPPHGSAEQLEAESEGYDLL